MAINRTGSGYVNLSRFLNANKNNNLGSTLTGGINRDVNSTNTMLNTGLNQFQTGLNQEQNRFAGQQDQANKIISNVDQNPSVISDQDVNTYKNYVNDVYRGPQQVANADTIKYKANDLKETSNLSNSLAGRGELLRKYLGKPNYTATQQRLDSLFIDPSSQKGIQMARQGALQTLSGYNGQLAGAEQQAKLIKAGIQQQQEKAKQAVNTSQANLKTVLYNQLTPVQEAEARKNAAYEKIKNGDITGFNALNIALNPEQVKQYQSAVANKYLNEFLPQVIPYQYAQNISEGSLANDKQRAQSSALAKLTDQVETISSAPAYVASRAAYDPSQSRAISEQKFNDFSYRPTEAQLAQLSPETRELLSRGNYSNLADPISWLTQAVKSNTPIARDRGNIVIDPGGSNLREADANINLFGVSGSKVLNGNDREAKLRQALLTDYNKIRESFGLPQISADGTPHTGYVDQSGPKFVKRR